MPRRERSMVSGAAGSHAASENTLSDSAEMKPSAGALSESAKIEIIVGPNEGEIARIAYQLWLGNGCSIGLDQADWFRAEAMLRNGPVASDEDAPKCVTIPGGRARSNYEMAAEFQWVGHWEVWESEWAGAHWVPDKAAAKAAIGLRL